MLSIFEKNKKSFAKIILAGIAVVLMIVFGLDARSGMERAEANVALKIDDEPVTFDAYEDRYNALVEVYRRQFAANFGNLRKLLNLEQRAIDGIIEETVLTRFSDSLGLTVGQQQLEQRLAQLPYFQKAGVTQESLERFLQAQGLSPIAFERSMRQDFLIEQLKDTFSDLAQPSERELRTAYEVENAKYEFEYVPFVAAAYASKVDVTDTAKIKEFYDSTSELHRKPKSVRYSYVAFVPAEFAPKVLVSPEDIQELYIRKERQFTEPKQVQLRQIVITRPKKEKSELEKMMDAGQDKSPAPADVTALDKQKKDTAEQLKARLDKGESFADVAKSASEDKGSAEQGGDLGWRPITQIEKEFKGAVDRLEKGQITEVLSNADKYVIFNLVDVKEPMLKPLDSVKAQLEEEIRAANAPEYARVEAENFLASYREANSAKATTLEEFAKTKGREVKTTESLLSAGEDPKDIIGLTKKVISTPAGESDVVRASDIDYVISVVEAKDSYVPDFEAMKEKAIAEYRAKEANRLAKEAAEAAEKNLRAADPKSDLHAKLEEIAKQNQSSVKLTAGATKNAPASDDLFGSPETRQQAFTLTPENPLPQKVASGPEGYFVYRLTKRTPPTEDEITKGLDAYHATERSKVENRLFGYLVETLKASSNIWFSPLLRQRLGGSQAA